MLLVKAEHKKKKWEDTSITGEALLENRGKKTNQYKLGEEPMAKNGDEMSRESENGCRKKINGSLYLVMEE